MALSQKTQSYLDEAEGSLRSALAWAAKNEHTQTVQAIAEVLSQLNKIGTLDSIITHLDSMKSNRKDKDGEMWFEYCIITQPPLSLPVY